MPLSIACPHCAKGFVVAAELRGKKVRCKACQETFVVKEKSAPVDDPDEDEISEMVTERPQPSPRPIKKLKPASRFDEEDEERPRRQTKKRSAKQSSSKVPVLLIAGGAALLFLLLLGVVCVIWAFALTRSAPTAIVAAQGGQTTPGKQAPIVAPQPPAPLAKAVPPADNQPPAKAPQADPAPPGKLAGAELYGDQGGDPVAPADSGLPNTVMRARRDDAFYKLSNPREGQTSSPGPKRKALLVDYEVVHRGKFNGGTLVIHTQDGGKANVPLFFIGGRDHGAIELVVGTRFGAFRFGNDAALPKNAEMYMTRGDARYRPPSNFMVSNSLVMGQMNVTTRPRNWTAEEIEHYGKPPPNYTAANAHPGVGEDVPPLKGMGVKLRYVEPEGRLLGLDYRLGEWEKEKCVGGLTPVFSADQPQSQTSRVIARPGYAVAGAEVHTGKYVDAIRLLFRRVKPDGSLDATDAYAGEWIGDPPTGKAETLANDGRRVMGVHLQQGAVIDRFALVVGK